MHKAQRKSSRTRMQGRWFRRSLGVQGRFYRRISATGLLDRIVIAGLDRLKIRGTPSSVGGKSVWSRLRQSVNKVFRKGAARAA